MIAPVERRWDGGTVVIFACGPSMMAEDADYARGRAPAIAVKDTWRLAPWAELLYSAEAPWWERHDGAPGFRGEKWIPHRIGAWSDGARWRRAAELFGLRMVASAPRPGVSLDPALIHEGYNSGFQALNIAVLSGAARILLLGFDCQLTGGRLHFFDDDFGPPPFGLFKAAFEAAAPQIEAAGIEVINCSRETALTCFRRAAIDEVL